MTLMQGFIKVKRANVLSLYNTQGVKWSRFSAALPVSDDIYSVDMMHLSIPLLIRSPAFLFVLV